MDQQYPRVGWKAKTIREHLSNKVNEWIHSIEDREVREMLFDNVIVTGGSICSMLLGEKINDYDINFRTKEVTKAVANYYADKHNARNGDNMHHRKVEVREEALTNCRGEVEERVTLWIASDGYVADESMASDLDIAKDLGTEIEYAPYRVSFMSQNAISLTGDVQLIIRFYGDPETIHDNFDFAHAMCWYEHGRQDNRSDLLILDPEAMEAMLSRVLIYKGSLYPIASIFRMKKFIERGWRITAGQQLKIMWQISELDLNDPVLLREQLTGVDMAYMYALIAALKNVDPNKINSTYVGKVIDRIFE